MSVAGVQHPVYNAGYNWGVLVNRPTASITDLEAQATGGNTLGLPVVNEDVGLEFSAGGDVRVKVPFNTGVILDTTVSVASLTSTGVLGVIGGDLHIRGTYKGQITVCAFSGTSGPSTNKGNVWIEGDFVGATSPRGNASSPDMAGIVAERMVYITRDPSRTPSSVLSIDAAIYAHNGEFTAERYWEPGIHGRVSVYGSITQSTAGSLGVFSGGGLISGSYYSIRHDDRFLAVTPPHFPSSDKYKLMAWWEN
jgi:hypothetical protein